jgi:inosine-uridine nucleoside N-ribohydrolase
LALLLLAGTLASAGAQGVSLAPATDGRQVSASRPRAVVIDTDAGPDDLMAIAFLLASPMVRVEAVCVGTGIAHAEAGAANILGLLERAGRSEVPLYLGRAAPLSGNRQFPAEWRRQADELTGVALPRAKRRPEPSPAPDYLAARLDDAAHPVEVLALGGLTNIAEAFRIRPAAARTVRQLVIMGGAVRVQGNLAEGGVAGNTTAEWNFYVDPEAARRVFASGARIRLIPLDATQRVPIDASLSRAVHGAGTPLAAVVAQIIDTIRQPVDSGAYFAWDPLAAAALVDPATVRFTPMAIEIRLAPPEEGRTVVVPNRPPNVEVAMDADAARFRDLFVRTLAGGR